MVKSGNSNLPNTSFASSAADRCTLAMVRFPHFLAIMKKSVNGCAGHLIYYWGTSEMDLDHEPNLGGAFTHTGGSVKGP